MRLSTYLTLALIVPITQIACADEYTVEPKPFKIETTLKGVFLPVDFQSISIKPDVWSDFTITYLAAQGTIVKKGDPLIGIDTQKLDDQLATTEKARASALLNLAEAKHDLSQLEITTPRSLGAADRNEKEGAKNLKWYTDIGHAMEIEETNRSVKRAEELLAYQQEELKQLEKMYGEDNKTEETEEIILTRTRNAVDRAKFQLKSTQIDADLALQESIPRKLKSMQRSAENSQTSNTAAQESLPRALELKRIGVAKAIHDDAEAVKNLAKLKADRAMMDITAPANGVVYYGSMKNGRWNPAAAAKVLKIGGKLPAHTTLMTFIPTKTPLVLSTFAAEANLTKVIPAGTGFAITHLNSYQSFPISISSIASYPETDGTFRATLIPTIPANLTVVPGMKATACIVTDKMDKALKVPVAYLTRTNNGSYTVKVKLADGKTADRDVTAGPSNKKWVVITKGLEKGQVIVK